MRHLSHLGKPNIFRRNSVQNGDEGRVFLVVGHNVTEPNTCGESALAKKGHGLP